MRKLIFAPQAWEDYLYWQQHDRKKLTRINTLIQAIQRDPFCGPGKPEALKHALSGYWSRRIDQEHRLIYGVSDDAIFILQCRYHY